MTSKNGYDKSKQLAYGTYVVKQIKGQMDTELVENTFTFTVSKEIKIQLNILLIIVYLHLMLNL